MSRLLTGPLDSIQLSLDRQTRWQILIYDTRSSVGPDTINDVVRELALEAITGPRDFTDDVVQFTSSAVASDFAQTGVAVPKLTLMIADPGDRTFDPVRNPAGLGRFLRRGNTIRIKIGDVRVPVADWPTVFTGRFVGQTGVNINRTTGPGGVAVIQVVALGREADFVNIPMTSDSYGPGQSMNQIATDVALTDMGLDASEVDFSNWGAAQNAHLTLQFIELPPIVAIASLMMVDGVMPRFNGDGILVESLGLITQAPDRVYTGGRVIVNIDRPFSEDDPYNCVKVTGLASEQSEIVQAFQDLITSLHITVGFFSNDRAIPIPWSDDMTQLAKETVGVVLVSVNSGLSILGGDETFDTIPASIGPGTVGGIVIVSTGYAPYILIFFGLVYVTLAAIPDAVLAFGGGVTVSIGRIIQALALAIVLLLMSKIGKGTYAFRGKPFEYVYKELNGTAELPGLTTQTRKKLHVMNQSLQTQSDVNKVARNMLDRQQALGSLRTVQTLLDLKLEPDDVFTLPGSAGVESYQIQSITYTGRRDPAGGFSEHVQMSCSELSAVGLE